MEGNKSGVRQSLGDFREKLQKRVQERMTRPSIAQALQEQNKKQADKKSPLSADIRSDKGTYFLMTISAIFTAALGLLLGLAPYRTPDGTSVFYHTDFLHIAIAIIYAVAFVAVTEAAFLMAKHKFHTREEGNPTQQNTMLGMMALAGISIVGTGWAGFAIGASVLGFLSDFQEIPHSAQVWVVGVVPFLLAVYGYLLTAYKLSSEEEKEKRLTDQLKRQQEREHKLNRELVDLEVAELMAAAEDKAYLEAVELGALSAGEVAAAKRAGKTLRQLEIDRGEDLNNDGLIGSVPALPAPVDSAPAPRLNFRPLPASTYKAYTLGDLLSHWGMTKEEAVEMLNRSGLHTSGDAFRELTFAGYMPPNFGTDSAAADRFRGLFSELVGNVSVELPPMGRPTSTIYTDRGEFEARKRADEERRARERSEKQSLP